MAIAFTCECGKKFTAKDDYDGRRAICPGCHREFVFRARDAGAREASPLPLVEPEDDEPEQDKPTEALRPFWTDPIIVFGWGTPLLALLVFCVYLAWPHAATEIKRKRPIRVAKAVAKRKPIVATKPGASKPKEVIAGPGLSVEPYVESFMAAWVSLSLEQNVWLRNCKLVNIETRRIDDEGRKISDLWGSTAIVNATLIPPKSGSEPRNITIRWRGLCKITPAGKDDTTIWFELTDVARGPMYRVHSGPSEWRSDFRAKVKEAESRRLREPFRLRSDPSSKANATALARGLQHLAVDFDVSLDELEEILETAD
jgi:hypothetical protein